MNHCVKIGLKNIKNSELKYTAALVSIVLRKAVVILVSKSMSISDTLTTTTTLTTKTSTTIYLSQENDVFIFESATF